jgi:hypothetical protein
MAAEASFAVAMWPKAAGKTSRQSLIVINARLPVRLIVKDTVPRALLRRLSAKTRPFF